MLLRALRKLSNGIAKYEVFKASRISAKTRDILLTRGIISVVESPPVAEAGLTSEIVERFESAGVETLADVIEADSVEGMTDAELKTLKGLATDMLSIEVPKSKCGCGR